LKDNDVDIAAVSETWFTKHIHDWADNNSMIINLIKTKELIFYNPRARG